MKVFQTYLPSPLGQIEIKGTDNWITSIKFTDEEKESANPVPALLEECALQLQEYLLGKRQTFSIPLSPEGTDFQQKVWQKLKQIPFGKTSSYLDLALLLGDRKLIRATGGANGRNPIAILIPCHRVIGSSGNLVGYAGGLWRKQWLLEHEQKVAGGIQKLF